jgi:hypothetical protein
MYVLNVGSASKTFLGGGKSGCPEPKEIIFFPDTPINIDGVILSIIMFNI